MSQINITIKAYLQLLRPANIITSIADVIVGIIIAHTWHAGEFSQNPLTINSLWLISSTIGLYGGGIVLNDVFDAKLDSIERPERPIPSGRAKKQSAALFGIALLIFGILAAWQVSLSSAIIALAVALLAVLYDAWGKHQVAFGPINMGFCRGGNLLLGISIINTAIESCLALSVIPVVFITAVTMVSRGEVGGGNRPAIFAGGLLYAFVIIFLLGARAVYPIYMPLFSLPFVFLFAWLVYKPLLKAYRTLKPADVGKAIKFGVLSLIVMDAGLAAGFAGTEYGLGVLLLLPISMLTAKLFAVT